MRLWREQPVSYGPVETLTPSNVRTLPSSVGPVWLPLSRCSRHGRKAATWHHRKCARKSADSKRSLSPTKKADKVPAKPQSCEIRNTSVQLDAPTNVMPDAPVLVNLSRAQRYVEGIQPRMTPSSVKNRFSTAALPTTL